MAACLRVVATERLNPLLLFFLPLLLPGGNDRCQFRVGVFTQRLVEVCVDELWGLPVTPIAGLLEVRLPPSGTIGCASSGAPARTIKEFAMLLSFPQPIAGAC